MKKILYTILCTVLLFIFSSTSFGATYYYNGIKFTNEAIDEDIATYELTGKKWSWHSIEELIDGADSGIIDAPKLNYDTDDFENNAGEFRLVAEILHTDASGTVTAPWILATLGLTGQGSAPASPVAGRWYKTDGTWDPAGLNLGYSYFVIYNDDITDYVANFDERGALHVSTITTTETEYIPVGYMTDGASAPDVLETVTSDTDKLEVRTFSGAANEDLLFKWKVPTDIVVASGIKFSVDCLVTAETGPSSKTWQFELQGCSLGSGDALNCTLGTAGTSNSGSRTDARYDVVETAYSSAVTITDLAKGEQVIFKLYRDVADPDDYDQLVGVTGVNIKYVRTHDTTF